MAQSVLDYLVGYLPMNETGFARFDVSGNGNNFVFPNNANLSYGTGKLSNALKFDGTGYLIQQNIQSNTNTVAFWIYPTGDCNCIFGDLGASNKIYISGTSLKFLATFEGTPIDLTLGTITLNSWNFVVCSFGYDPNDDTNYARSVINNVDQPAAGYSTDYTAYGSYNRIGNCANNTLLDEVAFYKIDADILDRNISGISSYLYNSGNARTYPFVNKWFYSASSTNLSTVGNWWNNSTHTTPAGSVPTDSDVIQIDSPAASGTANARDAVIPNTFSGTAYIDAATGAAVFNNINSAISGGQIDCNGAYVVYPTVISNINTDYISFGSGVTYVNYSNNANNIYYWQKGTFDLNTGGWTSDPGGLYSTGLPVSTNNIYLNGYYAGTLADGYPIVNVYNKDNFTQTYSGNTVNFYNTVTIASSPLTVSGSANFYSETIFNGYINGNANFYNLSSFRSGTINGNVNFNGSFGGGFYGYKALINGNAYFNVDNQYIVGQITENTYFSGNAILGETGELINLPSAVFGGFSVALITHDGATATVTAPVDTGYSDGDLITIKGADDALYNGTFAVTVDPNDGKVFSYTMAGTPAGNAAGTIPDPHDVDAEGIIVVYSPKGNLVFYGNSSYQVVDYTTLNFAGNWYMGGNSRLYYVVPSNRLFYTSFQAYVNSGFPGTFIPSKGISLSQLLHLPFPINI